MTIFSFVLSGRGSTGRLKFTRVHKTTSLNWISHTPFRWWLASQINRVNNVACKFENGAIFLIKKRKEKTKQFFKLKRSDDEIMIIIFLLLLLLLLATPFRSIIARWKWFLGTCQAATPSHLSSSSSTILKRFLSTIVQSFLVLSITQEKRDRQYLHCLVYFLCERVAHRVSFFFFGGMMMMMNTEKKKKNTHFLFSVLISSCWLTSLSIGSMSCTCTNRWSFKDSISKKKNGVQ